MPRSMLPALIALLLVPLAGPAWSGKAHEHGVAKLDVAVEPARISFLLDLPLDGLVGFERAPRTDAERAAVEAALATLREPGKLFRVDSAAGCVPGRVALVAPVLGLGATPAADKDGHADLEASVEFSCKDTARAGFVEVGLFDAFARLQRVDVQAATRRGQMKATLKRPTSRLPLAR